MKMEKNLKVIVDLDVARTMLGVAGFAFVKSMTDEEVFEQAFKMNDCYGVTYEVLEENKGKQENE